MADISKITLPNGDSYDIKDNGAVRIIDGTLTGTTTAESLLSDEVVAGSLIVNGDSRFVNPINGDLVGDVTGNVVGNVSGSAGTAGAFTSAKSVTLTGDVTGSASSTGGWSVATTVKDDSHNHTASTLSGVALSTDIGRIYYGSVDSTSTSTVFTATIDGITEYKEGLTVVLKNGVVTSASGFTININGLGAKRVYTNLDASSADTTIFNINYTMMFIYENRVSGGNWLCYRGYDSNSNDTTGGYARFSHGTYTTTTAVGRYVICLTKSPTSVVPVTAVNNSTATTKALTTDTFNPFEPIFYFTNNGSTTQTAANKALTASYLWTVYSNINLGYSFNTGSTLTINKDVYIKAIPTDGYMAKLASTPIVQDLPTSDDGFIYIKLGHANSTSNIAMAFDHPIYYYKNGEIRIWTNPTTSDWDENDSTSPSYVENRTHYRTSVGCSYELTASNHQWYVESDPISFTFGNVTKAYDIESSGNFTYINEYNHSDYSVFDDTVTSVVASISDDNAATNHTLTVYIDNNEECIWFYDNAFAILLGIVNENGKYSYPLYIIYVNSNYASLHTDGPMVVTIDMNVTLTTEQFEYTKKLDNRYLNGKLILSGEGDQSEIFNGENSRNQASGDYSHAEGEDNVASGYASHVEGYGSLASSSGSHAEGASTKASGDHSHAEGLTTIASGSQSHAEGYESLASGHQSHAEGSRYQMGGTSIVISGAANTKTYTSTTTISSSLPLQLLIGLTLTIDYVNFGKIISYTSNGNTLSTITLDKTINPNAAISNERTYPSDRVTESRGNYSHAEGCGTVANGEASHSEGDRTYAGGRSSHSEGYFTIASGGYSHAEGWTTTASGDYSHAEGISTVASGDYSHAEGSTTTASGPHAHAEGFHTVAQRRAQHVFGEYNTLDTGGSSVTSKGTYIEIVGKGTSDSARSNARTLDWSGNETLAGSITIGKGTSDEVTLTPAKLKQLLALL